MSESPRPGGPAGRAPTAADLLGDPAVSFALKAVIIGWTPRDPIDAALDARVLADLLERRAKDALE